MHRLLQRSRHGKSAQSACRSTPGPVAQTPNSEGTALRRHRSNRRACPPTGYSYARRCSSCDSSSVSSDNRELKNARSPRSTAPTEVSGPSIISSTASFCDRSTIETESESSLTTKAREPFPINSHRYRPHRPERESHARRLDRSAPVHRSHLVRQADDLADPLSPVGLRLRCRQHRY